MTLAPERTSSPARTSISPTAPHVSEPTHLEAERHTLNTRLSVGGGSEREHLPKKSGRPNPFGRLTNAEIEGIGRELDAIRAEVMDSRGARDAAYIRRVIKVQRGLEIGSRVVLLFSRNKVAWAAGTVGLSLAKILENMEIGHNVLHGQWDWMRDPKIHSTTWDWDMASPAKQWKHSHNELHHTYTNVLGRDNDLGYGLLRVDEDQEWQLFHLGQPIWHLINAMFFEYGIAAYDLELRGNLQNWNELSDKDKEVFKANLHEMLGKIRKQALKDYVLHPLVSGPSFLPTLAANFTANIVRNVWSNTVIICGHFPDGIDTFETDSIDGETRGEWYLRQMLGSGNISGSKFTHIMTGNLSHQIEHHLFPDMPSNRYAEISPKIQALMAKHDLHYVTGPVLKQAYQVYRKVCRLSLPNEEPGRSRWSVVRGELAKVVRGKGEARTKRHLPSTV
ncbi:fatty acid desaturase family protein [Nostocoides jenkinsii]|uniref:Putative fatty acid desaturase n=1 Tax=Nostocoides jenkinsii Ben 74 TaxID=1193518 RepID=A0A077MAH9_9MICO|nr:acyl-CoA desaturase [Tetrasphaera jenkinsii]CCI54366.1 putative fatty acid desaturase [Tetrasphaera jenkinsii Ben 74]